MNANEIVNVLRACGNGNSVCEKCPFYIREDSNECRFNAIYESADTIEAQQQEIARIKRQLNCERQTVSMLKSFGLHYGEFPRLEADKLIDKLVSDKDEQAGRIMRMESGLRRLKRSFQWLSEDMRGRGYKDWVEDKMNDIDALLGGDEG